MTRCISLLLIAGCVGMVGCQHDRSARNDGYRGARYVRGQTYEYGTDRELYGRDSVTVYDGRDRDRVIIYDDETYDLYDRRMSGADWGDGWYDDSKPEPYGWRSGYRTTRRGF